MGWKQLININVIHIDVAKDFPPFPQWRQSVHFTIPEFENQYQTLNQKNGKR